MKFNNNDVSYISEVLVDNIEDVLDYFNIDYVRYKETITSACPVHDGDNPNGFSILTTGVGNWQCFTHQCHLKHGNSKGASLIKLVQCLLKDKNFYETVGWLYGFFKLSNENIVDTTTKRDFSRLVREFESNSEEDIKKTPILSILGNLDIPSKYFLNRGFQNNTLTKFMVGDCINPNKPFFGRAVVPLLDESGKWMVGCSGRSVYNICTKCKTYHNSKNRCPIDRKEIAAAAKWRHSGNFKSSSYYYNLWNSKDIIQKTSTVIIVESPGNVWRLYEAGINNTVASLGTKFTKEQRELLERLGVINVILAIDNDDAGKNMLTNAVEEYKRFFNISAVETPYEDIGETPIDVIHDLFKEVI